MPMGDGRFGLGITKAIRTSAGVGIGDTVHVVVERDEQTRTVEVPDLSIALRSAGLEDRFASLAYTHQREYVVWVTGAKRAETRTSRVGQGDHHGARRPGDVVTEALDFANEVSAARARLIEFVRRCPEDQWQARPLGPGDPRTVAVIVDHVADAYEYIGAWLDRQARGETVEVTAAVVDELNARHAAAVGTPARAAVIEHLVHDGDTIVTLVGSLGDDQLAGGDGRVARLARIAALHADGHRNELEVALALTTAR